MILHKFFLTILPIIARVFPSNWKTKERRRYPQLWYCMPKNFNIKKTQCYPDGAFVYSNQKKRKILQSLCGTLTGHEISIIDRYGVCGIMDLHCRWCSKELQVPIIIKDS